MIYTILISLYCYLVIKVCLLFFPKSRNLKFLKDYRINFIEILLLALIIGGSFNYFYFKENEFKDLIVSRSLLWISFVASTLMLGVGVGMRYAIESLRSHVLIDSESIFKESKKVHDVVSQIWINVSIAFLFFIYSIMEISKPDSSQIKLNELITIYVLSIVFALLYTLLHIKQHALIRRADITVFSLLGVCILTFIFETNVNFLTDLPVTISFFLFIFVFILFNSVLFVKSKLILKQDLVVDKTHVGVINEASSIKVNQSTFSSPKINYSNTEDVDDGTKYEMLTVNPKAEGFDYPKAETMPRDDLKNIMEDISDEINIEISNETPQILKPPVNNISNRNNYIGEIINKPQAVEQKMPTEIPARVSELKQIEAISGDDIIEHNDKNIVQNSQHMPKKILSLRDLKTEIFAA